MKNLTDHISTYTNMGWALVGIPAGSKAPSTFGWQQRATPVDYWEKNPSHNVGLLHSLSGTVALDIDHLENTRMIFEALNIDLDAMMSGAPRIVGRPDRGKVLFRAPDDMTLTTRKISWPVDGDPRKTEVVFELRAGSVQDVLPPSIHPDTGLPYTWAGTPLSDGLPNIPDQLLTIWDEWDRFRPQMADVCPWKRKAEFMPPPKPRREGGQGQSVIAAYNAATPIGEALTRAGYSQFGARWLSPNSTSKIPGVIVFDDGRAYSHHASDPFDPSHTFDAFEIFCTYEHLGNMAAAVKAAAELLDVHSLPVGPSELDREMSRHGANVAAQIMRQSVAPKRDAVETDDVPVHLLTVPGVLTDFVKYAAQSCIKPQPQFDVQAALAFGAVVMGQRYITSGNNMPSLFFMNVGKTGTGKEHAGSVISKTLRAADLDDLLGPAGYTSEGGVLSALKARPAHIAIIDEFGNYLSAAGNRASVNQQQALSMMMECFGRQTDIIQNRGYSTVSLTDAQKKATEVRIKNPSLTVMAMTTPETFYDAVSGKDVASGLLNRFLIVESRLPRSKSRRTSRIDPPDNVIAWAKRCAAANAGGNLTDQGSEFPPVPVELEFTSGAYRLLDEYETILIERQNGARFEAAASMFNRSREMAMRVSLIVAVSMCLDDVDEVAMRWAIDYVDFYAQRAVQSMADNMAEGETDALRKKVAAAIKASGLNGMKMSELIKAVPGLGNLGKPQRDGLLAMVCEDFPIERAVSKPIGGGRPSIIHTWAVD
jgi:hypothetical protein